MHRGCFLSGPVLGPARLLLCKSDGGSPSPSTSDGQCQGHGTCREDFSGYRHLPDAWRKMKGLSWLSLVWSGLGRGPRVRTAALGVGHCLGVSFGSRALSSEEVPPSLNEQHSAPGEVCLHSADDVQSCVLRDCPPRGPGPTLVDALDPEGEQSPHLPSRPQPAVQFPGQFLPALTWEGRCLGPPRGWCVKVPGALRVCREACVYQEPTAQPLRRGPDAWGLVGEAQRLGFSV